jgi:prolipoprotein diacylglyceryltransferase
MKQRWHKLQVTTERTALQSGTKNCRQHMPNFIYSLMYGIHSTKFYETHEHLTTYVVLYYCTTHKSVKKHGNYKKKFIYACMLSMFFITPTLMKLRNSQSHCVKMWYIQLHSQQSQNTESTGQYSSTPLIKNDIH